MSARIYQPARTAMSSGMAMARKWILEFTAETPCCKDPLTGWDGRDETQNQVCLKFDTLEEAQGYAVTRDIAVRVDRPHPRKKTAKFYADNFRHDRVDPWSH